MRKELEDFGKYCQSLLGAAGMHSGCNALCISLVMVGLVGHGRQCAILGCSTMHSYCDAWLAPQRRL